MSKNPVILKYKYLINIIYVIWVACNGPDRNLQLIMIGRPALCQWKKIENMKHFTRSMNIFILHATQKQLHPFKPVVIL